MTIIDLSITFSMIDFYQFTLLRLDVADAFKLAMQSKSERLQITVP